MDFKFNDENKSFSSKRFDELRKELVLQKSSIFDQKNVNINECIELLINLIYLINQGEQFTKDDLNSLFFGVTKIVYTHSTELKRMILLFVKQLDFDKSNALMLTSPFINDINKTDETLKANTFRFLGHIIDVIHVTAIERTLKNVNIQVNIYLGYFK